MGFVLAKRGLIVNYNVGFFYEIDEFVNVLTNNASRGPMKLPLKRIDEVSQFSSYPLSK